MRRMLLILPLFLLGIPVGRALGDERMNALVGLYTGNHTTVSFEYDLILQFQKSKEWMGTLTGPYISEELSWRTNRVGLGFVLGKRDAEKGTFALAATVFEESRWTSLLDADPGVEVKATLAVFGAKFGMMLRTETLYLAVGLAY